MGKIGSHVLGNPRAKFGEVSLAAMTPRKRSRVIKAAEAFLREIQGAGGEE